MNTYQHKQLRHPGRLPALLLLTLLAACTQLSTLAYSSDADFSSILGPTLLAILLTIVPSALIGLTLGPRLGLGAPLLIDLILGKAGSARELLRHTKIAAGSGLAVGVLMLLLSLLIRANAPTDSPELGFRGITGGLLVSLNAAVVEEIWTRLGLMTLLVWSALRLLGKAYPSPQLLWPVIVLSAIAFALLHLPQLASTGAATAITVSATMVGNTIVGTLFGWLYWRYSLIAAMIGHLSVDLVLHVFTAMI